MREAAAPTGLPLSFSATTTTHRPAAHMAWASGRLTLGMPPIALRSMPTASRDTRRAPCPSPIRPRHVLAVSAISRFEERPPASFSSRDGFCPGSTSPPGQNQSLVVISTLPPGLDQDGRSEPDSTAASDLRLIRVVAKPFHSLEPG